MFQNRQDAGKKLATALKKYRNKENVIVIGLPRGGVVTAFEVANYLHAPLDVICPRKVGAPLNSELALGAITDSGIGFFNEDLIKNIGVRKDFLENACQREQETSRQRMALFRKDRPPLQFEGKTVILVDDGIATGATMKAAILSLKGLHAAKIVVAVPVSPPDTISEIKTMCDEVICLDMPWFFQAVGQFYQDFAQTEDAEVIKLLHGQEIDE